MKKLLAFLILLACVFTLCSCGLAGTVLNSALGFAVAEFYKDYEEEPLTFHCAELAITLTEGFYEYIGIDGSISYESPNGTMVVVEKYPFMYSEYPAGKSLSEYAEIVREQVISGEITGGDDVKDISEVQVRDGVVYFTFTVSPILSSKYMLTVNTGADALWVCYFICPKENYATYEPHFIKWAASITINNSNSEI